MTRYSTTLIQARATSLATLLSVGLIVASSTTAATIQFDNGSTDGLWETAANWNPDGVPTSADNADIGASFTTNLSSAQTIVELLVAWPNSTPTKPAGTSTLNILPGTNLQTTGTNGDRIGRGVVSGQLVGSSKGVINQTGGLLQITAGTNGLRLSQGDSGIVADSVYNISGGSVRGGPTNGTMTAPLQIGNTANTYNLAEFHVIGSGVTEARFEDVRMFGAATGSTNLHFSLDAGGVTPLIAEDEMRFTGISGVSHNSLIVDLIGAAPLTDITLITADRLNQATAEGEIFTGLPDGSPISATFGPYTYNWLLKYQDGSDNGILDASVKLQFVSRTEVPEATSLMLMSLGSVALAMLRRRGR
jgi:hypothetical protein